MDAAARQLVGEGFVHNRARMISATFLKKHLLVDYRRCRGPADRAAGRGSEEVAGPGSRRDWLSSVEA